MLEVNGKEYKLHHTALCRDMLARKQRKGSENVTKADLEKGLQ